MVRLYLVADFVDEVGQLLGLLRIHAGGRLVQQQQLGLGGQGPGDLQPALKAVGQRAGHLVLQVEQTLLLQQGHGLLPHPLLLAAVEAKGGGEDVLLGPHVLGDQYVVKHRQGGEQTDILEGAGDAQLGDLVGGGVRLLGDRVPCFLPA